VKNAQVRRRESDSRIESITREVTLSGITDIMFDRYPGDNDTKLQWNQKVYLHPETSILVLPATNIVSLLSSHNTNSAPKRLRDVRKYKAIANACLSFVMISAPDGGNHIPFLNGDGETITMAQTDGDRDPTSGIYLHRAVARLDKGIPNPKERPVLPCPWSLAFRLRLLANSEIKEQELRNLIVEAGIAIGLGTFRGVFGKFEVTRWE